MISADADFETRSRCDLRVAGAEAYSEHETTEIICLVVRTSILDTIVWWPGQPTDAIEALATDPDVSWIAHNAAFEQAIWRNQMVKKHGFSPIAIERWHCTQAAAAWKSLPLAQEKLVKALRLDKDKDMEGRGITLALSKPITKKAWNALYPAVGSKKEWAARWPKDTLPEITDAIRQRVIAYCLRDVEGEDAVKYKIGLLHSQERGIWTLDQKINQRGVRIDLDFVRAATRVVAMSTLSLKTEFEKITDGIGPGQIEKLKTWCAYQGIVLGDMQKATLEKLLDAEPEDSDATAGLFTNAAEDDYDELPEMEHCGGVRVSSLPPLVRRVLEIRQLLGSASIKKLARMRACVGSDGRARGLIQYHAAHTGRWGGRLFQPQNFPRGSLKISPEAAVSAIMSGDPDIVEAELGVHPIVAVASSLRHALIPDPGKVFLVGDYAGIEARIVLAMAGQHDKTALMVSGADVYLDMAEDIYSAPKGSLTKADIEKRQAGKNSVLGCGFQMGALKFHQRYCPEQPFEFAERVVQAYRKEWAPKVPKVWYALGDAAVEACQYESPREAYGVEYYFRGGFLCARLPSGWQTLWYPNPAVQWDERFDKWAWSYSAWQGGNERRVRAYGGLLTENAVQALARGLLVGSMQRVEAAGMPIVLTVHDEIVAEVDEATADQKAFEQIMAQRSPWAAAMQIPVQVEGWTGDRYRK